MKRYATLMTTIALFTTTAIFNATQAQIPGQPPPQQPGIIPPAPTPLPTGTATAEPGGTTITVSRTFTNDPNAITIIGTASSEQEKQAIAAKVQEAAPRKTVNNQLTVAGQGIYEPSGAERPKDKSPSEYDDKGSKAKDDVDSPDESDLKDQK